MKFEDLCEMVRIMKKYGVDKDTEILSVKKKQHCSIKDENTIEIVTKKQDYYYVPSQGMVWIDI